jgi:hypothetical protein
VKESKKCQTQLKEHKDQQLYKLETKLKFRDCGKPHKTKNAWPVRWHTFNKKTPIHWGCDGANHSENRDRQKAKQHFFCKFGLAD